MSQRQDPRAQRLTADASRRKRETETLALRNKHREEVLIKRRNLDADVTATPISDIVGAVRIFLFANFAHIRPLRLKIVI